VPNQSRQLDADLCGVLSPREVEVIEMAALGLTNQQVAARLNVTVHAVKFHLAAIYRKLGVANRTEAAVWFHTTRSTHGAAENGGVQL
jgi:DNA-binding NarL/FixJ family response regulator